MKQYRFEAEAAVELDVESAFDWYETEEAGLGIEFLKQLVPLIGESSKIRLDTKSYVPVFVAV